MIRLERLGLRTAERLIDFQGRSAAAQAFARDQLEGAVALHNMLADNGFAYLADEVGMGKTYIALGVVALLRHFHPDLRVLYLVPRANIQEKWRKEARNFVANNWRLKDLRVKSLQATPVVDLVTCESLADLAREVCTDAHRDFVLRMSSFSLMLKRDTAGWKAKRKQLLDLLPWVSPDDFSLTDKGRFKRSYARAINAALPHFDLLVVDEAHNFRHGYERGSTRNQLLGLVLGREDPDTPLLPGGGLRVDRVLTLSATPLETDYRELWNQLDLFGKAELAPELIDPNSPRDAQQQRTRSFMVRRLTGLQLDGMRYTKNMYRREWRRGGVAAHGQPLRVASERERLVVALVQKKVSDVLAELGQRSGKQFGRRFQMGMLASFESFLETAKLPTDDPAFDQVGQTDDQLEREGVDAVSIAHLARSYRERFHEPLPHPKMNAVADSLAAALQRGDKTLVFVRRVASVRELVEQVTQRYDDWLLTRLTDGVSDSMRAELEREFGRYRRATSDDADEQGADAEELDDNASELPPDVGGMDSFFAWFFRGTRKLGVSSGGWFRRRRLTDEKEPLSLFLDENYLDWLGGAELTSLTGLAQRLETEPEHLRETLRQLAFSIFRSGSRQRRFPRRRVFRAYQQAAVRLLADRHDDVMSRCAIELVAELGWQSAINEALVAPADFPPPDDLLGAGTAFCVLRRHALGASRLVLDRGPTTWPDGVDDDEIRASVRRHEVLRELLSASISLGHPFVALWRVYVCNRGSLQRTKAVEPSAEQLAAAYFDALAQESDDQLGACAELRALIENFDLIIDVNFPDARDKALPEIPKYLQSTLSGQSPVAGMSGRINATVVKQFRMPGYPYVLVTTDVLQEGEDLHTFAARVVHYGITWTPSGMEQRTGRIDRIGSLTHRRLTGGGRPESHAFLQVQFPYLDATVEIVQVREIFRRMDEFVALLHRGLGAEEAHQSAVDLAVAIHVQAPIKEPSTQALDSPFDAEPALLLADVPARVAVDESVHERYLAGFDATLAELSEHVWVEWSTQSQRGTRMGTARVSGPRMLAAGGDPAGTRQQPFAVHLRSIGGLVLLRFISPVGVVLIDDEQTIERVFRLQSRLPTAKICAVVDGTRETYNLTAEVEVPFDPRVDQINEAMFALRRCVVAADIAERELLRTDAPLSVFATDLDQEFGRG